MQPTPRQLARCAVCRLQSLSISDGTVTALFGSLPAWLSFYPSPEQVLMQTRQDKALPLCQPAWLIRRLIYHLDQIPASFSHQILETEPVA